jgi:hypothetical protein
VTELRRNGPETLIFWTLALTWPLYAAGALYIVGPALGWTLAAMAAAGLYLGPACRKDWRVDTGVPMVVALWLIGMLVLLLALWVGHVQWDLGAEETVKSTVGWMKGWALAALFPFAGAMLPIRRETLIRSQSIVGLVTLLLLPAFIASAFLHLPSRLFTSPLSVVGGPGPEYFSVYLYTLDPGTDTSRWQFYAPWSPFAGLLGVAACLFALEERRFLWGVFGFASGIAFVLLTKSRMSLVALAICILLPRLMPLLRSPKAWMALSALAASMAAFGSALLAFVQDSVATFKHARVASSRVRDTLQRIAFDRWETEAPFFGHGVVERGPHIVEYMPIGSHHTWFGLLYVKGLVGVMGAAAPLIAQTLFAARAAMMGPSGRLPFGLALLIVILTFGENLEIETYLFWPTLLLFGIHARESLAAARDAHDRKATVDKNELVVA